MPGPEINLHVYDTEETLLQGLRQGDRDACTCFVKRFAAMVYAQAIRLVADADEAENILQQTFLKACNKINAFDGRSGLGTWLYRIATNEALMKLRRQHITTTSIDELGDTLQQEDIPHNRNAWTSEPSQLILDRELQDQLEVALTSLPENLRVVFVLREMQGYNTTETATLLKLNENAVKVRLHRARLRLRELLANYIAYKEHA